MRISEELLKRMEEAEESKEEGIRIAVETILKLMEIEGVRGIHLMPLLWESVTPRIAEEVGIMKDRIASAESHGQAVKNSDSGDKTNSEQKKQME